jgi:ribosomal protein S6
MAKEKPVYDLTVLLDADAPSERRAEILKAIEETIGNGGEIVSEHDWGVRNLAYEITHRKDAEYHLIQFTGPTELLDRLRTALRVTDGVLRHRIIRLPVGMPPPPSLRPEPRATEGASEAEAPPAPPAEAAPAEAAATEAAPAAEPEPEAAPVEAPAEAAPQEPAAEEPAAEEPAADAAEAPPAS